MDHLANHYVTALAVGSKYYTYTDFQIALATFCNETNARFTIFDCKAIETYNSRKLMCDRLPLRLKYKYAKLACERFGRPRHEGRGIRNKGSKKSGCGAHVTFAARKTDREAYIIVLRLETKHSNQCEIRRKQKRIERRRRGGKAASTGVMNSDQNKAPNTSFYVQPELMDNDDNSMQEYNYPVKPVVVYSDDEYEEPKPVPIFHLTENEFPTANVEMVEDSQATTSSEESTSEENTSEENTSEDVKPPPVEEKPSLRALLLPAMALNFSQQVIQAET